ncbi:MAG: hypothetical protein IKS27_04850, partial [Oscillospiraceae bacterium]|nr:hypothetical protein [Oscillospiraceae bacterium]
MSYETRAARTAGCRPYNIRRRKSMATYHGLNELREMFLAYFESKGHLRLPSFSLIPQNDKSLLLINSGMA